MIFSALYQWASLIAVVMAVTAGLWRGGWPERVTALAMASAWVATALFQSSLQRFGVQTGVMIIDILLLAILLFVALKSDRWWPMWGTAFQAINVVIHLAVLADAKIWGWAYFMGGAVFSYLTMFALFVGSMSRPVRRKSPTA